MLDIDDFKLVNDVYGHAAGDGALQKLAESMKRCIRDRVTELPDTADELGYTIADYDYAEMPQVADGQWTVIIKAEYSSYEGLRFTSNDNRCV